MDFFDMNFSTLFLEKHGKNIYESICNKVKLECPDIYTQKYLEIIFDVACLSSWGMSNSQISKFLKNIKNINNININTVKRIHKKSIKEIEKYIKMATKDI